MSSGSEIIFKNLTKSLTKNYKKSKPDLKLLTGKVEKNISKFSFVLKTEFGDIEISSEKNLNPGKEIELVIKENSKKLILQFTGEKDLILEKANQEKLLSSIDFVKKIEGFKINAVIGERVALPKFQVLTKQGPLIVESENFLKQGEEIKFEVPLAENGKKNPGKAIDNNSSKNIKSFSQNLTENKDIILQGKVEKLVSPFKYILKTDFGKILIEAPEALEKESGVEFKLIEKKDGYILKPENTSIKSEIKIPKNFISENKISFISPEKIFKGTIDELVSLPKFEVKSDSGKIIIESPVFLKSGDDIKFSLNQGIEDISVNQGIDSDVYESIKDIDKIIKPDLKDITKIILSDPVKVSERFFSSLKKKVPEIKKEVEFLKHFVNPEKISGESVKKAVKYFWGSSFKDMKSDYKAVENFFNEVEDFFSEEERADKKAVKQDSKDFFVKESKDKLFDGMDNIRHLNHLKINDSSRIYFFIPFLGNSFQSAEFFIESEHEKKKKKDEKELRAVLKLKMSKLGIIMADLRLIMEKNIKIFFGVENENTLEILENGLSILEANLKEKGFRRIAVSGRVIDKKNMETPLLKKIISGSDESVFDIRV